MSNLLKTGREHGQALVLFAAGLAAFLGIVGLSIDIGQVVHARTDLQKIADAAGFAGAQELPIVGQANSEAIHYIGENGNSDCSSSCVEITTTSETNDTITVTTRRHVNYTFLRAVGLSGHDVTARAKLTSRWATGYEIDDEDVFPYAVWGDQDAGPQGNCPYGLCDGEEVIYRSNGYQEDNIPDACTQQDPNPDYTVCSNKFKGYFHAGTDIVQMNPNEWQTFSYGGTPGDRRRGGAEAGPTRALHQWKADHPADHRRGRDCGGSGEAPCTIPDTGQNVEASSSRSSPGSPSS
jgi:Flp pilus assembly protein TadG